MSKSQCNNKASNFNNFFNKIGKDTFSQIDISSHVENGIYWKCPRSVHSFAFKPITVDSIQNHLIRTGEKAQLMCLVLIANTSSWLIR